MAILITGGSKGIGLAIARAFAAPGKTVLINYRSDDAAAGKAKAAVEALGATAVLIKADAGTAQGCREIARVAKETTGQIDQLVHCAVDAYASSALEADPERFTQAVQTNGISLLFLVQAMLPMMKRGSTVFFLTSRGGRIVVPNYAAIGVGKALSESLVRYLAVELAPKGIRINCIAPSIVDTEAVKTLFGDKSDELMRHSAETNPMGRGVEDGDYTNLMKFLASPEAGFITGQVVFVNGGSNLSA